MELVKNLLDNHLIVCLPVVIAIVGGVLLFVFAIKPAKQPPFDKFSSIDDRKLIGKKKKIKEKKSTANGHVSTGEVKTEKSPSKETKRSPAKETAEKPKDRKPETNKPKKSETITSKTIEEVKNKRNSKRTVGEKPADFDDGNWKTVPTKADKKKKSEQSPAKKDKKTKALEIEKLRKFVAELELKYPEPIHILETSLPVKEEEKSVPVEDVIKVEEAIKVEEPVVVIEEKKEKKKEKKVKKVVEKVIVEEIIVEKEAPPKAKVEKVAPKEAKVAAKEVKGTPKEAKVAPKEVKVAPKEVTFSPKEVKEVKEETPKASAKVKEEASKAPAKEKEGGAAFDELGDVWEEAKVAKKSKKKARRDN